MRPFKGKGPVHHLDRAEKAAMIDAVLEHHLGCPVEAQRILDIGCGNGDISAHFAQRNVQYGVDAEDKRRALHRSFTFKVVDSERLPFPDHFFDVEISNHVIEHLSNQRLHLAEIRRTLRPGGVVYLATPNRSSPLMEGHIGNNKVLRYREMRPLFEEMGFQVREYSLDLIRHAPRFHSGVRVAGLLPEWLLGGLRAVFPSHVFVLSPRVGGISGQGAESGVGCEQ